MISFLTKNIPNKYYEKKWYDSTYLIIIKNIVNLNYISRWLTTKMIYILKLLENTARATGLQ